MRLENVKELRRPRHRSGQKFQAIAAVCAAWSLLDAPRKGRAAVNLFENIYSFPISLIDSVSRCGLFWDWQKTLADACAVYGWFLQLLGLCSNSYQVILWPLYFFCLWSQHSCLYLLVLYVRRQCSYVRVQKLGPLHLQFHDFLFFHS